MKLSSLPFAFVFSSILDTTATATASSSFRASPTRKLCGGEEGFCQPCTAGKIDYVDIGKTCDAHRILNHLAEAFHTVEETCEWNFYHELEYIFGTPDKEKIIKELEAHCVEAQAMIWKYAYHSTWEDIDHQFHPEFLNEYFDGGTFLNEETGNFKNPGGEGNPMNNRFYPTDPESYLVGHSIHEFYQSYAHNTVLEQVDHLNHCKNQAIMCCFGRDRQYGDRNGDCAEKDCDNGKPIDNSNLCYVSDEQEPVPYPEDEAIHCQGVAWANDENDPSFQLRFNNFFATMMHDRMYSRGYVGSAVNEAPMCGCVEDMPKVTRSDCSQVVMSTHYKFSSTKQGKFLITTGKLSFDFSACRGVIEDPNTGETTNESNDLASYINTLHAQGQLSDKSRKALFKTLVGHDHYSKYEENEEACVAAWEEETQGMDYKNW